MSAGMHTAGPWKRFGVYNHIEIRTEAGELVAVVGSEQLRAARFENARLIAAAPDMLALLQRFERFSASTGFSYPLGSLQELQEAIAKAAGSAP